jgi:pimeloyl-ACP methyl ester carboxylesterase
MKSVWESLHAEMAALSTAGEQRHIPGAGHYIQRDNPEAVLTAIADVVAKARQAP